MQDKYTGLSGSYVLDAETGERLTQAEYDVLQAERAAALAAPKTTTTKGANNGTV